MDLAKYKERQEPIKYKAIVIYHVGLDKKAMVDALQSDSICINGEYFKVPERALLECLINRRYGDTRLELEKIR